MKRFFADPHNAERMMIWLGGLTIIILAISCILIICPLELGIITLPRIGNALLIFASFLMVLHFRFSKTQLEITACRDITLLIFLATVGTMINRVLISLGLLEYMALSSALDILVACYVLNGVCFRSNLSKNFWFLMLTVVLSILMYIAFIYFVTPLIKAIWLITALSILFYSVQLIRQTDYNILGGSAIVLSCSQLFAAVATTGTLTNMDLYLIPDIQSICYCLILFALANCSRVGYDKFTGNLKHL